MIAPIVYLSTPSETATYQLAPVGTKRAYVDATYGYQVYTMVKATAAIAAYKVVEWGNAIDGSAAEVTANFVVAGKLAGVSQNAIASGSYGWVCYAGLCKVTTSADVAAGAHATTKGASASGAVDDTDFTDVEESVMGTFPAAIDFSVEPTGAIRLAIP